MFSETYFYGIPCSCYSDDGFRREPCSLDNYSLHYDREEYGDLVTGLDECFGYRYSTKQPKNKKNKRRSYVR